MATTAAKVEEVGDGASVVQKMLSATTGSVLTSLLGTYLFILVFAIEPPSNASLVPLPLTLWETCAGRRQVEKSPTQHLQFHVNTKLTHSSQQSLLSMSSAFASSRKHRACIQVPYHAPSVQLLSPNSEICLQMLAYPCAVEKYFGSIIMHNTALQALQ